MTKPKLAVIVDGNLAAAGPGDKDNIDGLGTAATSDIVQYIGDSQTDVMSQKAVTDAINSATKLGLTSDIEVTVGNGGDYATINAALEDVWEKYYPAYQNTGITVTIRLLSGFVMAEQVLVYGLDMGWIIITGEDAETVTIRSALTIDFTSDVYGFESYPMFGVSKGGVLPIVGQLFNMDSSGHAEGRHGVLAVGAGSSAHILPACGVRNAGGNGIHALWASIINAANADVRWAVGHGIVAAQGSTINASNANANGAGAIGIFARQCSTINANAATANSVGADGIFAQYCSTIDAINADVRWAVGHGIVAAQGSTINASNANANGAGISGINSQLGSTINANAATANNVGTNGFVAQQNSIINAYNASAINVGNHGFSINSGSTISAVGSTGSTQVTVNTLTANGIIFK